MDIMKIARMGHPVLLQRAQPVAEVSDPALQRLIDDMIETMEDASGAGLAAPQVHMSLRLFVFRVPAARVSGKDGDVAMDNHVVINPELTPLSDVVQEGWEGCLSIPGLQASVPRAAHIRYRGLERDGTPFEREAVGFHARVVQHEADHLDGILYPMRMSDFSQFGFNEELARAAEARAAEARAAETRA